MDQGYMQRKAQPKICKSQIKINLLKKHWIRHISAMKLAQTIAKQVLKWHAKQQIPKEYNQYLKVFKKKPSERLPEHKPWDHEINLKVDWKPKPSKIYPLSVEEMKTLQMVTFDHHNHLMGHHSSLSIKKTVQ